MKKNLNLSIVIPLYNSARTIKETIKSLNHKSLKFINDIVIYNDGSNDNSLQILKKLKSSNPKIRYFTSKTNRGGAYARNFAIKKTKNELIKVVDADNIIDAKSLITLYRYALNNNLIAHYQIGKFFSDNINNIDSEFNFSKLYSKNFTYKKFLNKLDPLKNFIITKKKWLLAGKYNEKTNWDTQDFVVNFSKKVGDIPIVKNTFYFHRRYLKDHKSYWERQELKGENYFNSYKLFETIFEDLNKEKLLFLIRENIFMRRYVTDLLNSKNYKKSTTLNKELKLLDNLLKIILFVKKKNLLKSKFFLKKYLSNKNIIITDLILFLAIRSEKSFSKKEYNELKKYNNLFIFIKIFSQYPYHLKLILFYLKFLSFIILKKLKNKFT